jgi:microcystin-dependent protein
MHPQALGTAGGGQPHNNMPPYLALTFIIALQGIFPQRP